MRKSRNVNEGKHFDTHANEEAILRSGSDCAGLGLCPLNPSSSIRDTRITRRIFFSFRYILDLP